MGEPPHERRQQTTQVHTQVNQQPLKENQMKSFIVAHFVNGVIIDYKRKPLSKAQAKDPDAYKGPQPLTLTVATNAVKRLNTQLGEVSPQDHWACMTIKQLSDYNKLRWTHTEQSVWMSDFAISPLIIMRGHNLSTLRAFK